MVVLNNMADPKENIFYARLKEFTFREAPIVGYSLTFFSFLHGFDREKCHNMLALILETSIL